MIFFIPTHIQDRPKTPNTEQNISSYYDGPSTGYPSKTMVLENFYINFSNTNQKYPEFHIVYKDLLHKEFPFININYNIFININDGQVFLPKISNARNNIYLIDNYLTNGTLGMVNNYKISIFIANITSTNPQNDPTTFIKTFTYNVNYKYNVRIRNQDLINNTFDLKIPYIYDLNDDDNPKNKFYDIKIILPDYHFTIPRLLQNIMRVIYPNDFQLKAGGNFSFDNISTAIDDVVQNHYSKDTTVISNISFGNQSYYDWKTQKIKLGVNPDGPTFKGIALPPDSGKKRGLVTTALQLKNKLFNISITADNQLIVDRSLINGPDAIYKIVSGDTNWPKLKYQDKFLFLLKDIDKILSAPINEETIWKYKEKI